METHNRAGGPSLLRIVQRVRLPLPFSLRQERRKSPGQHHMVVAAAVMVGVSWRSIVSMKTALMFLSQGFEDLEAASIIDVLGWTKVRDHLIPIELRTCAFYDQVAGKFGLRITVDHNLRKKEIDPSEFSAFILPGGFHDAGFDEAYCAEIHQLASQIHGNGGVIATMCVGVLPIADAGLLKGKRATTYNLSRFHNNVARLEKAGAIYTGNKIETDSRIISCSGPASSLDVALELVELLTGKENADEVKKLMMV
jgi:4-methyl-5(b-hydroxyethyl)-thiazole monophosphate biosynthesis